MLRRLCFWKPDASDPGNGKAESPPEDLSSPPTIRVFNTLLELWPIGLSLA